MHYEVTATIEITADNEEEAGDKIRDALRGKAVVMIQDVEEIEE
jgi:hypothetical protein